MAVPYEMLLHPELLSNDQLIHVIQERCLKVSEVQILDRYSLLELFHQYCVPFGQRKYRDTGRGKVLNKSRHLSPEAPLELDSMQVNNRKITLANNIERLKPPPDLLSGHIKRIRLDYDDTSKDTLKRKMSIESMEIVPESPPQKKDRKSITWP